MYRTDARASIRRARSSDHAVITGIAEEVYGELGDYGSILPSWFVHPGVEVYVDTVSDANNAAQVRSFFLLGFFEPLSPSHKQLLVDLLAIAVVPHCQRQGMGRKRSCKRQFESPQQQLTVSREPTFVSPSANSIQSRRDSLVLKDSRFLILIMGPTIVVSARFG